MQVLVEIECRRCQVTDLTQLLKHRIQYFERFKSLKIQDIGCQDQVLFLIGYSTQDKTYYLSSLSFENVSDSLFYSLS